MFNLSSLPTIGGLQTIQVKGKQQIEIVRDPAVIASYLRRVEEKKIEYYMEHPDELAPTGDDTEDELRKVAYVFQSHPFISELVLTIHQVFARCSRRTS